MICGRDLAELAPKFARVLDGDGDRPIVYRHSEIRRETVWVEMRDGIRLATDLYLPPVDAAPAIAVRTPYGRAQLEPALIDFARCGYVAVAQDCRGTGDSEPDEWDFYVYEGEDSIDCVDWVTRQSWFEGFLGSLGGSYVGGTQWCMAQHPRMSAIVPQVAGIGVTPRTGPRFHMFLNAYARTVGKGADKVATGLDVLEREMLDETLAGGYFNEPLHRSFSDALLARYPELRSLPPAQAQRRLYEHYCALPPDERAAVIELALGSRPVTYVDTEELISVFGHRVNPDAHMSPRTDNTELARSIHAPALFITGWYDWGLDDTLATWDLLAREGLESVRSRNRLLITPHAHNTLGYREGVDDHPELERLVGVSTLPELWLHWYRSVRNDDLDSWPTLVYYLMGANEWQTASAWPPPEAEALALYLGPNGTLSSEPPATESAPDRYTYDPADPPPTVGGSIVSYVYTPGSCDVSGAQARPDVLTYTTQVLEQDVDVVGPLQLVLYASTTAEDTDFSVRLSDLFPDGRAIQLQHVTLRARYRNREPELLVPGNIYRLEIDMWATANRFRAGHCIRLDVSSADFPKFDRHTNRVGTHGSPVPAEQRIYHDSEHPSHLLLPVLTGEAGEAELGV